MNSDSNKKHGDKLAKHIASPYAGHLFGALQSWQNEQREGYIDMSSTPRIVSAVKDALCACKGFLKSPTVMRTTGRCYEPCAEPTQEAVSVPPFNLDAHVIANGHRPLAPGEESRRRDGWTAEMLPARRGKANPATAFGSCRI